MSNKYVIFKISNYLTRKMHIFVDMVNLSIKSLLMLLEGVSGNSTLLKMAGFLPWGSFQDRRLSDFALTWQAAFFSNFTRE